MSAKKFIKNINNLYDFFREFLTKIYTQGLDIAENLASHFV